MIAVDVGINPAFTLDGCEECIEFRVVSEDYAAWIGMMTTREDGIPSFVPIIDLDPFGKRHGRAVHVLQDGRHYLLEFWMNTDRAKEKMALARAELDRRKAVPGGYMKELEEKMVWIEVNKPVSIV